MIGGVLSERVVGGNCKEQAISLDNCSSICKMLQGGPCVPCQIRKPVRVVGGSDRPASSVNFWVRGIL